MFQEQRQRAIFPTLLIVLGWGLLVCNVFVLFRGGSELFDDNLAEHAARTISTNLFHSAMLAFGAIALSLVAYLHFKQNYSRAALTSGAIAAVLAFSLLYPAASPASMAAPDNSATELSESEVFAEGLVSGIVFSDDRPAAVVGNQVLYEGDVKNGVTIVKITKEQVQFEKNGMLWTQEVQSIPPKYWR